MGLSHRNGRPSGGKAGRPSCFAKSSKVKEYDKKLNAMRIKSAS